jgi:2-amino-4-hydroxy-6-hydroxymethyldihydropteridine diphosphokinase
MLMRRVFLGLGSNLGNREENLEQALLRISEYIGPVVSRSSIYETEPWGFESSDQFLNLVAEVRTDLRPSGVIGRLLMIESFLGRLRDGKQYSSRVIDIDILFYGNRRMNRASLIIPHPKIPDRKFVLVPLCEMAPDFIHPVIGKTVSELLKVCPDTSKVVIYKDRIL